MTITKTISEAFIYGSISAVVGAGVGYIVSSHNMNAKLDAINHMNTDYSVATAGALVSAMSPFAVGLSSIASSAAFGAVGFIGGAIHSLYTDSE